MGNIIKLPKSARIERLERGLDTLSDVLTKVTQEITMTKATVYEVIKNAELDRTEILVQVGKRMGASDADIKAALEELDEEDKEVSDV